MACGKTLDDFYAFAGDGAEDATAFDYQKVLAFLLNHGLTLGVQVGYKLPCFSERPEASTVSLDPGMVEALDRIGAAHGTSRHFEAGMMLMLAFAREGIEWEPAEMGPAAFEQGTPGADVLREIRTRRTVHVEVDLTRPALVEVATGIAERHLTFWPGTGSCLHDSRYHEPQPMARYQITSWWPVLKLT